MRNYSNIITIFVEKLPSVFPSLFMRSLCCTNHHCHCYYHSSLAEALVSVFRIDRIRLPKRHSSRQFALILAFTSPSHRYVLALGIQR